MATVTAVGLDVAEGADVDDEADDNEAKVTEDEVADEVVDEGVDKGVDDEGDDDVDTADDAELVEGSVEDTEVSVWELDWAATKPASPTRPVKKRILATRND